MIQRGMGHAWEKLWYMIVEWEKRPAKATLFCHVTQKKVLRLKSVTMACSSYLTVSEITFYS